MSIIYNDLSLEEAREFFKSNKLPSFRGDQLFSAINKNNIDSIDDITVFSKDLRKKLKEKGRINKVKIKERYDSQVDDTRKYLFLLEDGNIIEGVFMEYSHGYSVCISTQVGCRMGCSFCASTKEGLVRNLSSGEMLSQIYLMEKDLGVSISNIVLMGSGEPLDNYDEVVKFLNMIHDEKGHNISYRNISLSTCGLVDKIEKLSREELPITLSISLHSPFDEYRQTIMPVAKKYSVKQLIRASREYEKVTKRRITFEYTLIEGVNDREEDINKLSELLSNFNCHINVIPLNPIKEYKEKRPEDKLVFNFVKKLNQKGINATVRREKGLDISASCGQLRRNYLTE